MDIKLGTLYTIVVGLIGLVIGVAGTFYGIGADRQAITSAIAQNKLEIVALDADFNKLKKETDQKLNGFSENISSQIDKLTTAVNGLQTSIIEFKGEIKVINTLIEMLESKDH